MEESPGGLAEDRDAVVAQATRNHTDFAALQHTITNVLVDLEEDRANVRANFTATVVGEAGAPTLQLGAVYRFRAERTPQGWRLAGLEVAPVWPARAADPQVSGG